MQGIGQRHRLAELSAHQVPDPAGSHQQRTCLLLKHVLKRPPTVPALLRAGRPSNSSCCNGIIFRRKRRACRLKQTRRRVAGVALRGQWRQAPVAEQPWCGEGRRADGVEGVPTHPPLPFSDLSLPSAFHRPFNDLITASHCPSSTLSLPCHRPCTAVRRLRKGCDTFDGWDSWKHSRDDDGERVEPEVLVGQLSGQLCVFVGVRAPRPFALRLHRLLWLRRCISPCVSTAFCGCDAASRPACMFPPPPSWLRRRLCPSGPQVEPPWHTTGLTVELKRTQRHEKRRLPTKRLSPKAARREPRDVRRATASKCFSRCLPRELPRRPSRLFCSVLPLWRAADAASDRPQEPLKQGAGCFVLAADALASMSSLTEFEYMEAVRAIDR